MSATATSRLKPLVIFAVILAGCLGWVGVFLVIDAFVGHGGGAGNILRAGFGLLAFLAAVALISICAFTWKPRDDPSGHEAD